MVEGARSEAGGNKLSYPSGAKHSILLDADAPSNAREGEELRDRRTAAIVISFVFAGEMLQIAAFWIGLAFMGAKGFGSHWVFGALYFLGLWPDWFLPRLPSQYENLYLVAPAIGWGLVGLLTAKLILKTRRGPDLKGNENALALHK